MYHFNAAAWSRGLKLTSSFSTLVLAAVTYFMYRVFPPTPAIPIVDALRTFAVLISPIVAAVSALFVVRAYELQPGHLRVHRLFWYTPLSLQGVTSVWHDPLAMRRSLRLLGNGGLYSITGFFHNTTLGRYRAFVTDPTHAVVITLPDRRIVLSPTDPDAFLQALVMLHPGVQTTQPGAV